VAAVTLSGYPQRIGGEWTRQPIHSSISEAQREFDRGLSLVYSFDYDEAIQAFRRASALDPAAPMPYWGIGLALGPNLNDLRMEGRMAEAHAAAQRALELARGGPQRELDYTRALSKRYTAESTSALPALYRAYADAMRDLTAQYPDDLDAKTLFAESVMLSGSGPLWLPTGGPGAGTVEALDALEFVLARAPRHLGANHYYIHLIEDSPTPERGLPSAERLESEERLNGHLLHMPSHIYVRLGDYRRAVTSNLKAVAADSDTAHGSAYGRYAGLKAHSREFLAGAACLTGQSTLARRSVTNVFVLLRFNRWVDLLRYARPTDPVALVEWQFAHVLAQTGLGKLDAADEAFAEYEAAERALPARARWWSDPIEKVLPLFRLEMSARFLSARGDRVTAIERWRRAVAVQDQLTPGELPPWPWFHSTRESLGAALFLAGDLDEAEHVFRQDLVRYHANPRSLYGLWQTLERLGSTEAARIRDQFQLAWSDADVELAMEDL
jgi:tetratricopeptide (TPR) repeat protein